MTQKEQFRANKYPMTQANAPLFRKIGRGQKKKIKELIMNFPDPIQICEHDRE